MYHLALRAVAGQAPRRFRRNRAGDSAAVLQSRPRSLAIGAQAVRVAVQVQRTAVTAAAGELRMGEVGIDHTVQGIGATGFGRVGRRQLRME